jgi:hypothetical protein
MQGSKAPRSEPRRRDRLVQRRALDHDWSGPRAGPIARRTAIPSHGLAVQGLGAAALAGGAGWLTACEPVRAACPMNERGAREYEACCVVVMPNACQNCIGRPRSSSSEQYRQRSVKSPTTVFPGSNPGPATKTAGQARHDSRARRHAGAVSSTVGAGCAGGPLAFASPEQAGDQPGHRKILNASQATCV